MHSAATFVSVVLWPLSQARSLLTSQCSCEQNGWTAGRDRMKFRWKEK